jgi:hypothetical protein
MAENVGAVMQCTADSCRQGRDECDRVECDADLTCEGVMSAWPLWLLVAVGALLLIACLAVAAGSVL